MTIPYYPYHTEQCFCLGPDATGMCPCQKRMAKVYDPSFEPVPTVQEILLRKILQRLDIIEKRLPPA